MGLMGLLEVHGNMKSCASAQQRDEADPHALSGNVDPRFVAPSNTQPGNRERALTA
jgi:hypothetical protein